jgi:ureidoacrylate peracid hydrolase
MMVVKPDISTSALIVVDMQNDFVHPDGAFGRRAIENPDQNIDMVFLSSTVVNVKQLVETFREVGRPVIYITHVVKKDNSDAAIPYWRNPRPGGRDSIVEGTWGAQIVDELAPRKGEHIVVKKGYGGFNNTSLDTILRNQGVNNCIVCGVTTSVCVSSTIRGGVEANYRMVLVSDATAEVQKDLHEAELKILARAFGDIKTTDEVIRMIRNQDK